MIGIMVDQIVFEKQMRKKMPSNNYLTIINQIINSFNELF